MAEPERIIVNKSDEATLVAEKLIDAQADEVIFVIPKGSEFTESPANFKLLKREAEVLKKKVLIESSDAGVLAMATQSGLLIAETVAVAAADNEIVKVKISTPRRARAPARKKKESVAQAAPDENLPMVVPTEIPTQQQPPKQEENRPIFVPAAASGEPIRPARRRPAMSGRGVLWLVAGVIVLGGLGYLGLVVLPKAEVMLETQKTNWLFTRSISVDKTLATPDSATLRIPGQLFIQKASVQTKRPANSTSYLQRHAQGTLIIYNAYSSDVQGLVKNTRFAAPSGAIYRLVAAVTVPGAHIVSGQIVAASTTAAIVADKAGEVGNSGPIAHLDIPGFIGSAKYQKFYGELPDGASGGFVGTTKVPTDADILAAKNEGARAVEAAVRNQASGQTPTGFTAIDSATQFSVVKQDVNPIADASGNFTVTTEGQLSMLAFREKDMYTMLNELLVKDKGPEFQINSQTLDYQKVSSSTTNLVAGKLTLPIDYKAQISERVDVAALMQKMQGQSEEGIKRIIYALPGIANAKVSLWPFWVRTVPFDSSKITVTVK